VLPSRRRRSASGIGRGPQRVDLSQSSHRTRRQIADIRTTQRERCCWQTSRLYPLRPFALIPFQAESVNALRPECRAIAAGSVSSRCRVWRSLLRCLAPHGAPATHPACRSTTADGFGTSSNPGNCRLLRGGYGGVPLMRQASQGSRSEAKTASTHAAAPGDTASCRSCAPSAGLRQAQPERHVDERPQLAGRQH
jgi:hypothetical protein